MLPTIHIGPVTVQTPGLVYLIGISIGLLLSETWSSRFQVKGSTLHDLIYSFFIAGILGARLSYVASAPRFFLQHPLAVVSLNPFLLDIKGGILIALFYAGIFAYRKDIFQWKTLDALTPLAAMVYISTGVSHLASGKAYGATTDLPWGITLWNATRHPTQVYEICIAVVTFGAIWYTVHHPLKGNGGTFALFLILTSTGYLITTAFLGDSRLLISGIRVEQWSAYLVLALSLWLFGKTMPKEG